MTKDMVWELLRQGPGRSQRRGDLEVGSESGSQVGGWEVQEG